MSELNLYATLPGGEPVRPDERFHWQIVQPECESWGWDWLFRTVTWRFVSLPSGEFGRFSSSIFLWVFRWYNGTSKCDGTRTFALRAGQLGGDSIERSGYVMTTTYKELASFRLSWSKPDRERYDNMGGI